MCLFLMASDPLDDPQQWRRYAQEAYRLAKTLDDENERLLMLEIAERYVRIAGIAEAKLTDRPPQAGDC